MAIFQYDKRKELIGQYRTVKDAADKTGFSAFEITQNIQGSIKLLRGTVFSTIELIKSKQKKNNYARVQV